METTLTKRTLSGAVVKASSQTQNIVNKYLLTVKIEKTGHNLLIGGTVNIKITGLNQFTFVVITNGVLQAVSDFFNKERIFTVIDANTLICNVDINSSFGNEATIGGTPLVQVNNDKILLKSNSYNFELLNNINYPNLRVWDSGYKFKLQEKSIGSAGVYDGISDFYSDGTITQLSDLNEKDLSFRYCEYVEISIVDASNDYIGTDDYTKTTNIGLIINEL
ncbi:MAG: hypothetical protein LW595_06180 [Rickettsiales bacterium]|nr:hypothetical protein [Rickettsiales bacterium]